MSIQDNKAIVRSLIDGLFTDGDLSAVDTYLAADCVLHDPPLGVPGDREGMRTAAAMIRKAFPDWHSDLHMLVGEGDIVVERFTASGTGSVLSCPSCIRCARRDEPANLDRKGILLSNPDQFAGAGGGAGISWARTIFQPSACHCQRRT